MSEREARTRLAAAPAYVRRGWAVHLGRPGDKRPLPEDRPQRATADPGTGKYARSARFVWGLGAV
jgi:hypothetical protein